MLNPVVCVEVENCKELGDRMVLMHDGMTYSELVSEICKRFEINCDRSSVKLRFRPVLTDTCGDDTTFLSLRDDYDVIGFLRYFKNGSKGPKLKARAEGISLEAGVASNNLGNIVINEGCDVLGCEAEGMTSRNSGRIGNEGDVAAGVVSNVLGKGGVCSDAVNRGSDDGAVQLEEFRAEELAGENLIDFDVYGNGHAEGSGVADGRVDVVESSDDGNVQLNDFMAEIAALKNCLGDEGNEVSEEAGDDFNGTNSVTFSDRSDLDVGRIFKNKEDAKRVIRLVAMRGNFEYRTVKSSKLLFVVGCKDELCTWKVQCRRMANSEQFEIRTYNGNHSCGLRSVSKGHMNATYDVIADICRTRFEGSKGPSPKEIINFVLTEVGCHISYWRAWRARQQALESRMGSPKMGYAVLPGYFEILKKYNPGIVTALELDGDKFKYCYFAFGASLHGFQYLRKVLCVDATFLKAKYKGSLICASAEDGNRQIFPVAFAMVDSENDKSYTWFFERLKESIPDNEELCFISDRNSSIWKAVATVYPSAHHGCCEVHLWDNCKVHAKAHELEDTFRQAARAYTISEFDRYMAVIKAKNKKAYDYLMEAGVQKFSRAHFPGNRYNLMTSNIAESLNKEFKEERGWPLFALFVNIQKRLTKWFYERRTAAARNDQIVTPKTAALILDRFKECSCMVVEELNSKEFSVRGLDSDHIVNLATKKCTCNVFTLSRIPCKHAMAALRKAEGSDMLGQIQGLCDPYYSTEYWRKAYEMTVYPTPKLRDWMTSKILDAVIVKPPLIKLKKGRRKDKRYLSAGEHHQPKRKRKCQKCGEVGHYEKRCRKESNNVVPA